MTKVESFGIVVDTNVIVSSLLFGGKPKRFMEAVIEKKLKVYTSPQMVSEMIEVLRKKFSFSDEKIRKLETEVLNRFKVVYPKKTISAVRDTADNKVLEVAIESGCKLVVTGDKDLLTLGKYKGILIIKPSEFLNLVSKPSKK